MSLTLTRIEPKESFKFFSERLNGLSADDYCQQMSGWDVYGIHDGHECIGSVATRSGHVHIAVDQNSRKKWASKRLIKEILNVASINGLAYTTLSKGDEFRKQFAERLGFRFVKELEGVELYEVKNA